MNDKHPIHTTLSTETMRILERYEKELGCKNAVLERALQGFNKGAPKSIDVDPVMTWLEIDIVRPLLGRLAEGSVFGIIGPPMSGKTLFACAMLNDFLARNEKYCVFASSRSKLSYLIPVTNSLGMKLGNYSDKMSLDFCEINALDGIYRILQKSKPKIIVIDNLNMIRENESDDPGVIFNSSGWKILSEEIKKQKIICVIISENEVIGRYCDIAIKMHKSKNSGNPVLVNVVKNIGLAPSDMFKLEMNGRVKLTPLLKVEISKKEQLNQEKEISGSYESLAKIANSIKDENIPESKVESMEQVSKPIAFKVLSGDGIVISDPERLDKPADLGLMSIRKTTGPELTIETLNSSETQKTEVPEPKIIKKSKFVKEILPEKIHQPAKNEKSPESDKASEIMKVSEEKSIIGKNEILKLEQLTLDQQIVMAKIGINLYGINFLRTIIPAPHVTRKEIWKKMGCSKTTIHLLITGFTAQGILEPSPLKEEGKKKMRNLPIVPDLEKIRQEFGDLIKVGLLPLPADGEAAMQTGKTEQSYIEISEKAMEIIHSKTAKIASAEELAEKLNISPDAIKNALTAYSKNGGKQKINIEQTKENFIVFAL